MPVRSVRGFTLIELMIAVVIVGILGSIAYPSYVHYVTRSNRSAVESYMLGVASKEEQYLLDARQYAADMPTLGFATLPSNVSGQYNVTLTADNTQTPPTYLITATPIGSQAGQDTQCGSLTLDQSGAKGTSVTPSPAPDCW